ncbi:putative ribosomal N-acetyltransferase YdaF [compost metagenome]
MTNAVPTLKTKRLFLKPLTLEDVPNYSKYFIEYEVIRHLSHVVPWPYPKDGVVDYLETFILPSQGIDRWTWGIFMQNTPSELIGCIDLWREGHPENRGFWLGKPFWGQGLMTEAAEAVTNFAFQNLDFDKLVFSNALGNIRSRRIKEKTGARFVGTRPAKFVDPSLTEAETWELNKNDWQKL